MTNFSDWLSKINPRKEGATHTRKKRLEAEYKQRQESENERQQEQRHERQQEQRQDDESDEEVNTLKKIADDLDYKIKMLMAVAEEKEAGKASQMEYSNLLRKMQLKSVKTRIEAYDVKHRKGNKDYKGIYDEDDEPEDEEARLEKMKYDDMDTKIAYALEEKLGLKPELDKKWQLDEKKREAEKKRIAEEDARFEQRQKEYNDRVAAIRNSINSYDSKKKEEDPEYKTYNELEADYNKENVHSETIGKFVNLKLTKDVEEGDYLYNTAEKAAEQMSSKNAEKLQETHFGLINNKTDAIEDKKLAADIEAGIVSDPTLDFTKSRTYYFNEMLAKAKAERERIVESRNKENLQRKEDNGNNFDLF